MPTLTVITAEGIRHSTEAEQGANLRRALQDAGLSPYTALTSRANCGGRGLCATCGVWVRPAPEATHWHDRLAADWGYPRLSCQITVEHDLEVEIPEKVVWGKRRKRPVGRGH
ncbi:MAG: 2Fe-2S iron-sulfur cluster-binding protein [Bacteroidota bacterium]